MACCCNILQYQTCLQVLKKMDGDSLGLHAAERASCKVAAAADSVDIAVKPFVPSREKAGETFDRKFDKRAVEVLRHMYCHIHKPMAVAVVVAAEW